LPGEFATGMRVDATMGPLFGDSPSLTLEEDSLLLEDGSLGEGWQNMRGRQGGKITSSSPNYLQQWFI
jgi:hypothetical protein